MYTNRSNGQAGYSCRKVKFQKMFKVYHILDADGNRVQENIPSKQDAHDICMMIGIPGLTVIEEKISTVKGYGRDPDLH